MTAGRWMCDMLGLLLRLALLGFLWNAFFLNAQAYGASSAAEFIDVHNHLHGIYSAGPRMFDYDFEGAARVALQRMQEAGIKRMYIMPPPISLNHPAGYDFENFLNTVKKYSGRFSFLGGGGTLNVMIQQAVHEDRTTETMKRRLEKRALEILSKGALGFGELTAEHVSLAPDHPYESAPPDHPLFLLLADIAASHDVPIDIHMEAVPEDMPLPSGLSPFQNPKILKANISAFERLLSHNRKAKIIWAHVGWCQTGRRTHALCAELLERHPNLYMSFKIGPDSRPETRPMEKGIGPKGEWLDLILRFPDRFIIGSDQFYVTPRSSKRFPEHLRATTVFLSLLPPEIVHKLAIENPKRIFTRDR